MTLYPEAQKRAQAELDQVLGGDRLPNFSDKDRLPYVHALLKEVLRWIPVLPLGNLRDCEGFRQFHSDITASAAVPHRATHADQYKGYHIPAGASVLGNTW